MKVNRIELSDFLGCAPGTVDAHVKKGCPYLAKPDKAAGTREWMFESADVVEWLVAEAAGGGKQDRMADATLRERLAIAGLKELELGERQKVLVHVDDVGERVSEQYGIVKSRLKAIPGRLAQLVSVESDPAKCLKLIKLEVDGALEAITDAPDPEPPEDEDDPKDA